MLYFFLVFPFIGFIIFQNVPKFIENRSGKEQLAAHVDSVISSLDTLAELNMEEMDTMMNLAFQGDMDSLVNRTIVLEESRKDTLSEASNDRILIGPHDEEEEGINMFEEKGPFSRYFTLLFMLLGVSLLAGWIYNRPFKRFFGLLRRRKEPPEKLQSRCKKWLFGMPLINSLIITLPNTVVILYSWIFLISKVHPDAEVERSMFIQLHYLTIVATLLEFLFVYYWQKHRVHIKYIDHLYSEVELRKQVFKKKGGKIRNRFLAASGMTTFLPLVVVLVYLVLSITSIKDLDIQEYSEDHKEILFGPWSEIIGIGKNLASEVGIEDSSKEENNFFYVNAIDSIVMLVGIGNGILVSFVYLLLFIRWTSRDITWPLKELLTHIRNTRGGKQEQYSIVRTNDEIGELAEGYNEMTQKIHAYVQNISRMNLELEEKVKERTREVVEQKEEIEAQKEEIEAQLDLATLQRDTILNQKDQILDSIRYAERIQAAILPPVSHLNEQLSDHFILFKPRDIVSGDFYWTTQQDDKILLAVADCTGHGVPGAFLSVLGISSMNEIVKQNGDLSASEILEKLRDFVIKSLHQTGSKGETQDGIEIAICILNLKNHKLEYAGANRPLYVVSGDTIQQIKPDRMPIGIYDYEVRPFTSHSLKLKKNDSIYLFSDGYVDQLGGPLRKTFRSRKFRKLLLDIRGESMSDQKQILMDTLNEWQGEVEQIDDILVMGIRV
jgi:serine phosphatase RsbU (regulator of sigma subunit)